MKLNTWLNTLVISTLSIHFSLYSEMSFAKAIANHAKETTTHETDQTTKTTTHTTNTSKPITKSTGTSNHTSSTTSPTALKASPTALNNAVSQNFATWVGTNSTTGKPNTNLTTANIETQLQNSKIRGQEAAALAAIGVRVNGMTTWDPQSLTSINQKLAKYGLTNAFPNASYASPVTKSWAGVTVILVPGANGLYTTKVQFNLKQLQTDINDKNSSLYKRYEETLNNLRASFYTDGRINLYGGNRTSLPTVSEIRQGPEGDCYFVSSIEALLNSNPNQLQSMLKHDSGNTYTVTFPNQAPITVTPTHTEVAMFSYVKGGGAWLAIFAVAMEKSLKNSDNFINIIHGGHPYQVLSVLTGTTYNPVSISGDDAISDRRIKKILKSAFSNSPTTPIGIEVSNHALSITQFIPENPPSPASVIIQNPWGTNGPYVTPNGTRLIMTNNGQMTVPIKDLSKDGFVTITAPATLE